jgi:hypothetical protein
MQQKKARQIMPGFFYGCESFNGKTEEKVAIIQAEI